MIFSELIPIKKKKKNIDKKILNQYKNQYSIITINGLFQKNESKIPSGISVNTFDKLNNTDKKIFHKFKWTIITMLNKKEISNP